MVAMLGLKWTRTCSEWTREVHKFRALLSCWRPESRKASWDTDTFESLEMEGEGTSNLCRVSEGLCGRQIGQVGFGGLPML
jgi:hypothetical protein